MNREKSRKILNADLLASQLSKLVYVYSNTTEGNAVATATTHNNSTSSKRQGQRRSVNVTYFEGKTFEEQARFFRDVDLLVSGHGAQLTGLMFMADSSSRPTLSSTSSDGPGPRSCKHVLELYPKNYAIPAFFGSLAVQLGIRHSYLYYGPSEVMPWQRIVSSTYEERNAARKFNFCPNINDLVRAIADLVINWYRCHGCYEIDK